MLAGAMSAVHLELRGGIDGLTHGRLIHQRWQRTRQSIRCSPVGYQDFDGVRIVLVATCFVCEGNNVAVRLDLLGSLGHSSPPGPRTNILDSPPYGLHHILIKDLLGASFL
ncbi:hypothetical protein SLEP1_g37664 [Rubroshorea leprosula]|uniref:Uncharacterized protein n=1 Tax=Rubroshorea leprosula TaxID=152421 RepID=A0AAV5KVY7_9ROSI|nr:hypothetical protein SLEP1_g37664 [Rubroshorea leprosula]